MTNLKIAAFTVGSMCLFFLSVCKGADNELPPLDAETEFAYSSITRSQLRQGRPAKYYSLILSVNDDICKKLETSLNEELVVSNSFPSPIDFPIDLLMKTKYSFEWESKPYSYLPDGYGSPQNGLFPLQIAEDPNSKELFVRVPTLLSSQPYHTVYRIRQGGMDVAGNDKVEEHQFEEIKGRNASNAVFSPFRKFANLQSLAESGLNGIEIGPLWNGGYFVGFVDIDGTTYMQISSAIIRDKIMNLFLTKVPVQDELQIVCHFRSNFIVR